MGETLSALAERIDGSVIGDGSVAVGDVVQDHRDCTADALFVARRGLTTDGHAFVAEAAGSCGAVCVETPVDHLAVPQLVVADTRSALGVLAASVHGDPFSALRAIGVTGTNGKTMVTRLIASIVSAAGGVPASAGTLGWAVGATEHPLARTSPEASDLQRMAASMVAAGADVAAFEVSSHALSLDRVAGAFFAVAAFTNLSQDHLDFHADMGEYFAAKASLFVPELSDHAVVWVDDPAGARLASETPLAVTTVGTAGDVAVRDMEATIWGTSFSLDSPAGTRRVSLALAGAFNVSNAAVATACALHLDIPLDAVVAGLEGASPVRGRFERIATGGAFTAIVDYAHTPDGISNAIASGRDLTAARIIVVVGAGGDRDARKRPAMGAAAAAADVVIVTTDNPRSEEPAAIADEVMAGVSGHGAAAIELDRRIAIRRAVAEADRGDLVLILGKGHEQGQEFADRTDPFDDATVVAEEAAAL